MLVTSKHHLTILNDTDTPDPDYFLESGDINLRVDTDNAWPDSIRVALVHLAHDNGRFHSVDAFRTFKHEIANVKFVNIIRFIERWIAVLDSKRDPWAVQNYISSGAKALSGQPPFSSCPRCAGSIWPDTQRHILPSGEQEDMAVWLKRAADALHDNPSPSFCIKCGQRFKKKGDSYEYKGTTATIDLSEQFYGVSEKLQPTFEDIYPIEKDAR